MEKRVLDISWASLWRVVFFIVFGVAAYMGLRVVAGLFLAIIISSGLEFLVDFFERRGMPRTLGVIVVFLACILVFVVIIYLIIPFVLADLNSILTSLNKSPAAVWLSPIVNIKTTQSLSVLINRVSSQLFGTDSNSPFQTFSQILSGAGLAVAIVIISFYLSLSRDGVERFIKTVFPGDYEEYALRVYERSRRKIGSWFRTQIMLSVAMGLTVWIALFFLGVKHSFVLGLMTALFELVPFVGPILSGAVAILFALSTSTGLAISTFVLFLILHQFEANILVPLLTRRSVGLHPVIVIFSLLMGIELGGLLGALIAVPTAAVLQEVLEERSARKLSPVEIS